MTGHRQLAQEQNYVSNPIPRDSQLAVWKGAQLYILNKAPNCEVQWGLGFKAPESLGVSY